MCVCVCVFVNTHTNKRATGPYFTPLCFKIACQLTLIFNRMSVLQLQY